MTITWFVLNHEGKWMCDLKAPNLRVAKALAYRRFGREMAVQSAASHAISRLEAAPGKPAKFTNTSRARRMAHRVSEAKARERRARNARARRAKREAG